MLGNTTLVRLVSSLAIVVTLPSLTWIHQDLIRKGFALSVANPTEFLYVMPQRSRQWSHCLDYLRQAVMCAADRTLETVEGNRDTNGETLLKGADGWGATHACRDYKGVYDWAEKHRSADHVGIDSVD